ncbi:MAG: YciI family protein [Chitinophagales bacterium]
MKEYLLLFRGGDARRVDQQQSPEAWQEHMQKWNEWMQSLAGQGKLSGAQPLGKEGKVVSGNGKTVTDGPFIEGKEIVGGYLICKADSFDEAVVIAKNCPIFEHDGIVEVREIQSLEMNQ